MRHLFISFVFLTLFVFSLSAQLRLDVDGDARFDDIIDVFSIQSSSDLEFTIDKNNSGALLGFFEVFNGAGNHLFWVNEVGNAKIFGDGLINGKLGINMNSFPTEELEVNGNATFDNIEEVFGIRSSSDLEFTIDKNNSGALLGFFEVFNGAGNHMFWVNESGNSRTYGNAQVDGKVDIRSNGDSGTGGSSLLINDPSSGAPYNGLQVIYGGSGTIGGGLYARALTGGGYNVGRPDAAWAPIHASAFNVDSDKRVKKDIKPIDERNAEKYLKYLRNIETATFWYNHEDKESRPYEHIGVIAQSLPNELLVKSTVNADGTGGEILGVGLADWLGLVTVGVKAFDQKVTELEEENQDLKEQVDVLEDQLARVNNIEALLEKADALEAKLAALENLESKIAQMENDLQQCCLSHNQSLQQPQNDGAIVPDGAYLEQNRPNPFNQQTIIQYYLPADTKNAQLHISDLSGKLLETFELDDSGLSTITIDGGTLVPGTFFYTLVVDGQVVDTKRMVLTR